MKLAVAVLSSILLACSVTTANPVNPSAAKSAESSTSAAIPTATTSTESEYRTISYEEAANLVDLSQLSESDVSLIEGYLQMDREHEEMEKACDLAGSEKLHQQELIKQLNKKYSTLVHKSQHNNNDPAYEEKVQSFKLKLQEEREKLEELEKKYRKFNRDFLVFSLQTYANKAELAERFFGDDLDMDLLYLYVEFLKFNPSFVENIYKSLTLRLNKQPGSEQASTSGTQSSSQHHESPSSSKTSTVQPTQTSSSTQGFFSSLWETFFGSSRTQDTPKSKNEPNPFSNPSNPDDSDDSFD
ncbi:hypothetical protein BATDEDRAFT_91730 [Batrachochytrium dendrobatidis JAM81]|uniref:Uncharacterized protein n=1 Tax=Batrachochytrium dendrobatidis (strain JAM81 / FGSC 10211) TaxID=684364 RepID=F4PBW2_BATDJ|nr:uncharacterized protein BATDEDRAFT_91730 [Batrachochytrium dendrobatidis JAM81]EGF77522.1 hypothetical protein BATDEDRAFT_91730 [Batrachochytrium dendrobatidis JAM81]|eukprot:XP_006682106.1 hypothetical protein BATDEDRAFT_91730 [Batrachochytrium dendrobatidis JAM81]